MCDAHDKASGSTKILSYNNKMKLLHPMIDIFLPSALLLSKKVRASAFDFKRPVSWFMAFSLIIVGSLSFAASPKPMIVKVMPLQSENDHRHAYKVKVITAALEATVDRYGPYRIEMPSRIMSRVRAFRELTLEHGEINTIMGVTSLKRESDAIAIPIPIRRGLLNYRLLLTQDKNIDDFKSIKTAEQLKAKTVGLGQNWLTADVMSQQGHTVVTGTGKTSLIKMLIHERFDYMLLGANEIYQEIDQYDLAEYKLSIVPNLAVYINMPLYTFVSKYQPLMAERITAGLKAIHENGVFQKIFEQEYGENIQLAKLSGRHLIYIDNPVLPESVKHIKPEFWLDLH